MAVEAISYTMGTYFVIGRSPGHMIYCNHVIDNI